MEAQGIKIYQPPIDEDDEHAAAHARSLIAAMPFAVIGSEKDVKNNEGKVVKGRQYIWGVAEVENEDHCDFKKVRSLLIRTHMLDLIQTTEEQHYENYRAQQMETRKFGEARPRKLDNPKFKEEEEALRKRFTEQVKIEEQRFRQWEQKLIAERDRLNKDLEATHAAYVRVERSIGDCADSLQDQTIGARTRANASFGPQSRPSLDSPRPVTPLRSFAPGRWRPRRPVYDPSFPSTTHFPFCGDRFHGKQHSGRPGSICGRYFRFLLRERWFIFDRIIYLLYISVVVCESNTINFLCFNSSTILIECCPRTRQEDTLVKSMGTRLGLIMLHIRSESGRRAFPVTTILTTKEHYSSDLHPHLSCLA